MIVDKDRIYISIIVFNVKLFSICCNSVVILNVIISLRFDKLPLISDWAIGG